MCFRFCFIVALSVGRHGFGNTTKFELQWTVNSFFKCDISKGFLSVSDSLINENKLKYQFIYLLSCSLCIKQDIICDFLGNVTTRMFLEYTTYFNIVMLRVHMVICWNYWREVQLLLTIFVFTITKVSRLTQHQIVSVFRFQNA